MKLPVNLAGITLAAWLLAALAWVGWAQTVSALYPCLPDTSGRRCAWMILVAAPITVLWTYFAEERWLRLSLRKLFPAEAFEIGSATISLPAFSTVKSPNCTPGLCNYERLQ